MPTGATATKPATRSGSSVTSGRENRPLIEGDDNHRPLDRERSRNMRSQVSGEPWEGADLPKPGRSTA